MQKFSHGFRFLNQGWGLLRTVPNLKFWVAIPFLIDIILLVTAFAWGWTSLSDWTEMALGYIADGESWVFTVFYYPLKILFFIGFSLAVIYFTFLAATVVASPFNAIIAEKVLIHNGLMPSQKANVWQWLVMNLKMIGVSLVRAVLFAVIGIIIFVFSFVPFLNIAGAFVSLLIVAFDSSDYAFEVLEMNLKSRLGFFRANFHEYSGMAAILGLTLLIPGLTLLVLPISVAGSAHVIAQIKLREKV